jgi:large conductance mechanosensitive channel
MSLGSEFKDFVLRGNVVDLAVGVVIGASFGAVVKAFTGDFITPLVTAVAGKGGDFGALQFTLNGSPFKYGDFVNTVITFLITAAVIFFFVVKPVNYVLNLKKGPDVSPSTKDCPKCLSTVPIGATKCAFCTSDLPAPQ